MAQTLNQVIKESDHTAIIIPDGLTVSYKQFRQEIESFGSSLLENGLQPGTCVSLVLPNNLEFLVSFLGITTIKCKLTLLNPSYMLEEFKFYLKDTESKVILVPRDLASDSPVLKAASELGVVVWKVGIEDAQVKLLATPLPNSTPSKREDPTPDDIALILHTSGTTSQPKGVPLTHLNLTTNIRNIAEWYKLTEKDTSLIVMPLFHVHGLIGATLSTLISGGTVIVPPRFSASTFWKDVEHFDVTWYSAVPTIHQILLSRADDDKAPKSKLRFIRSCSSSLAPVIMEKLEARFGAPVLEAYGMTEACHQMASNPLPPAARKIGSVGQGTNVQIAILDTEGKQVPMKELGEVCIKGKNVTLGYLNNPKANKENWTEDGWFRTGDQGFLDEEGYLTLTGRIKELINRGGEKIAPLEIDSVMLQHDYVAEAISFGFPDEKYGEEVAVAVVLKDSAKERDRVEVEKDITEFLKKKLAAFKVPKRFYFADSLPKNATGKIQRRHISAHFLGNEKK